MTNPSHAGSSTVENHSSSEASFAETAMKLGGKSDEEARRMGAIDKADDQVETLFAARFQTVNSPIHRAVWDRELPIEVFRSQPASTPPDVEQVMQRSLEVVRRHRENETLLDDKRKITDRVLYRFGGGRLLGTARRPRIRRQRSAVCRRSRRFSRRWRCSIPRSPGWPRCTAASARSTRCEPSARRNKNSGSCPSWPAANGSPPSL